MLNVMSDVLRERDSLI